MTPVTCGISREATPCKYRANYLTKWDEHPRVALFRDHFFILATRTQFGNQGEFRDSGRVTFEGPEPSSLKKTFFLVLFGGLQGNRTPKYGLDKKKW